MSASDVSTPRRLVGLDLFRAVAVFGMLVAHVGPASVVDGRVLWQWEIFHSRMPAMFAFAAGVSLALTSGGQHPTPRAGRRSVRTVTAVRAVALAVIGALLASLGTPAAVILMYFAVYFLLAIPLLGLRARDLALVAAGLALVGPVASYLIRSGPVDVTALPARLLVSGDYPAATWMPFVVAGMAVGRLDLDDRATVRRLALGGATLTLGAYGASALALRLGARAQIESTLDAADPAGSFSALMHAETGVTPTGSWAWLVTTAPHSGSWGDVLGCLGVCLLFLGILIPAGHWLARRPSQVSRWSPRVVVGAVGEAFASVGSMVLSVYVAHIVAMAIIQRTLHHSFSPAQPVWMLLAFTVALTLAATAWRRWRGRGPVESLLHRVGVWCLRRGPARRPQAG